MTISLLLLIHYLCAVFFIGYILVDRLIFRPAFSGDKIASNTFYNKSRKPQLINVSVLAATGLIMLFENQGYLTQPWFVIKIVSALLLIPLFFLCSAIIPLLPQILKPYYRHLLVLLALIVLLMPKIKLLW